MKKLITIFIYTIFSVVTTNAQTISGIVKDNEGTPVNFATVVLCNATDTTQISYSLTDLDGRFSLKQPKVDEYLLYVSLLGYKPKCVKAEDNIEIILEIDTQAIDEVVVKGYRPISRITASGVQTTVANTVLSNMGTGNEVLKRIPMVTGEGGSFKVFGRGAAKIYINNREVRDPSELDNLNSTDIQNIEVISNPGSRYDASVKAVINIRTVKNRGEGFSINARSSFYTWSNQDYINQINTNYRKGKLDVFANVYYSNITSVQKGNVFQKTVLDTLWLQNSYMDANVKSNKLNGTIGVNYEAGKNHNLGFRYDVKTSPNNNVDKMIFNSDVYADGQLFDKWENNEQKYGKAKIGSQANLYYAGKIKKLAIDFNADYLYSGVKSNNVSTEKSTEYGDRVLHSSSDIDNKLWAGKIQLTYPIWKGELSAGSEYVKISRSDEYINKDLYGFSSKVDVDEQNIAFYTQYKLETTVGELSAGVRYENANYDYLTDGTIDGDKSRKYRQWFPNLSYSMKFGQVGVQLSYDSKVTRPSYGQLSNNLLYVNRFSIQTGNPYLKPTISQEVSLMGVWKFIQAKVSYTHQKDAVVMWIDRYKNDPKVSVVNYKNIPELPKLSAFAAIAPTFGVYMPQLSVGMEKYWQNYSEYGVDMDMQNPVFFASINNTFELPHNIIINLDAEIKSRGYIDAAYLDENNFRLNFGISKSFYKKSLQIKLALTDITNQSQSVIMYMPQTELKSLYHFDNREASVTIRYYFNSVKNKYKGSGAGQNAKDRL